MYTKNVITIGAVNFLREKWTFDGDIQSTSVSMEYVEHSTDHYYPDTTTEVDISKEDAILLIEFLKTAYGI